jgi:ATP-dependent helicase IRC3
VIQDRPFQEECEGAVLSEYDKGVRRMLISLATGTGKTIVFSKLYEKLRSRLPGQMIVLAHTEELVDQNRAKMLLVNPDIKVDKEMAEHKADPSTADVIMASVATLGRKGTKRVDAYNWERVDKLVIDEAHHSTADSYKRVIDLAIRPEWAHKLLLGVTATPQRSDGKALAEIYQKVAYVYSIRQAIEDGWLVDIRGYRVRTDTDLSEVEKSGGDFVQSQLAAAINNPERNRRIVAAWKKLGEGRSTVAFCAGIEHAKALADEFVRNGIEAAAVWGDDPDRTWKLEQHRAGNITVLCNCGVLVEGYDDWRIGCIILARPTQSCVLFTQMVGRVTRLQEGLGNLKKWLSTNALCMPYASIDGSEYCTPIKQDGIIIDVVDNSVKHSLITLPTLMGLTNGLDLKGKSLVGAIQKIEGLQEQYPSLDFKKLEDLDQIKQFIENANFFEVRFPEEVEANSDLTWYRSASGGYRLNIPKDKGAGAGGYVRIFQNMLDQWEVDGLIDNKKFHGVGNQMENAFKVCDEQIRKRVPDVLTIISRKATWHGKKATKSQLSLLKRFYPHKQMPADLTAGQASRLIGERIARKAK